MDDFPTINPTAPYKHKYWNPKTYHFENWQVLVLLIYVFFFFHCWDGTQRLPNANNHSSICCTLNPSEVHVGQTRKDGASGCTLQSRLEYWSWKAVTTENLQRPKRWGRLKRIRLGEGSACVCAWMHGCVCVSMRVCMCARMCVLYAVHIFVYAGTCSFAPMRGPEENIRHLDLLLSASLYEGLSLNLKLVLLIRLAGQQAPRILWTLPPRELGF